MNDDQIDQLLHPEGRCGCHGEGRCQWCRLMQTAEERDEAQATLAHLRVELAAGLSVHCGHCGEVLEKITTRSTYTEVHERMVAAETTVERARTRLQELVDVPLVPDGCFCGENPCCAVCEHFDALRALLASLAPEEKEGEEPLGPDALVDLISLVHDNPPLVAEVEKWTREMRQRAETWAAAVHLHASDNYDVKIPPKPEFL